MTQFSTLAIVLRISAAATDRHEIGDKNDMTGEMLKDMKEHINVKRLYCTEIIYIL